MIPLGVKRALQLFSLLIAAAALAVGVWGRLNYVTVQHDAVAGIGWLTVPTARFMLWLTNGGEIIPLMIIAALIGAAYYCVVLLTTTSMLRRVALAQQAKSKDN
ncbi:MAG TPA: hypothetical protein VIQ80_03095 [Candidatus Saccharimonadales bacterium]